MYGLYGGCPCVIWYGVCTTTYVWLEPYGGLIGGALDGFCISATAATLGMEPTRCSSVPMNVDGRESLPMVAGAEMTGLPSGPYVMLLAFHNLSNSQASLALTDDQSAALCNSDVGLGADGVVER